MRASANELHEDAVEALLEALRDAGLDAASAAEADIALEGPSGAILVEVKAASIVDADRARAQMDAHARALRRSWGGQSPMVVLVADQLSEEARDVLRGSELGYLDRRGALWLRGPGLIVNDTSLAPFDRHRRRPDGPIRGRVALGVALRRLMHPDAQESVREIASAIGASPSTVHEALAALREHALVEATGAPLIPDLFEAVAAVWRPERIPVRREPEPGDPDLELGLHDDATGEVSDQGWVVAGDVGAAAAGARIVVASGAPPDFYVPTQAILRRAVRRLHQCSYDERGATVALALSPEVTAENDYVDSHRTPWLHWPIAHPVVIALDLAQDLSRGHEILSEWTPQGFRRVW